MFETSREEQVSYTKKIDTCPVNDNPLNVVRAAGLARSECIGMPASRESVLEGSNRRAYKSS